MKHFNYYDYKFIRDEEFYDTVNNNHRFKDLIIQCRRNFYEREEFLLNSTGN